MIMCSVLLFLLDYPSINMYWQQTYHRELPAQPFIERHEFLQYASKLTKWAATLKNAWWANLTQANKHIIAGLNKNLITPPHAKEKKVLRRVALPPPEHAASPLPQHDTQENTDISVPGVILTPADKVLFVGDSLMQGVAPHIRKALHKQHGIIGIDLSKQNTGLAYPGFFNWPKQTAAAFEENSNIRLMVVFLGPNDPWDMPSPSGKGQPYLKFKSDDWEKVYRSRIREMLAIAHSHAAKVIWLSPPNMRRTKLNDGMIYLEKLFSDEMNDTYGYFVPTSTLLGCYNNQFSSFVDLDGKKTKVRIDDGVHFTLAGQKLIADKVLSLIHVR